MKSKFYTLFFLLTLLVSVGKEAVAQSPDWQWSKASGGLGNDYGFSLAVDPGSGDVYTTGYFQGTADFDPGEGRFELTSNGGLDIYISKLDKSGNFIWAKAIGAGFNDFGRSIAVEPSGSGEVYTIGYFQGTVDFDPGAEIFNLTSVGSWDIFIVKLDSDGNFIWAKAMGGADNDFARCITVDPLGSGDIYVGGSISGVADLDPGPGTSDFTSNGLTDIFISKYDRSGNFVWAKVMGGIDKDGIHSIAVDAGGSGAVYTTGYFNNTVDFNPDAGTFNLTSIGDFEIFISKYDLSGNFIWAKAMGGTGFDVAYSIAVDPSGSGKLYITGSFEEIADFDPGIEIFELVSTGLSDIFISKLDGSGNLEWVKAIGGPYYDEGYSIAVDPGGSGDIYTTGYFEGAVDFDPGEDSLILTFPSEFINDEIFVSRLDSLGNLVWAKAAGGTKADWGQSITLDATGHVYVIGSFYSPSISFDSTTIINSDAFNISSDIYLTKLDANIPSRVSIIGTHRLNIFPNPTRNELTIELDKGEFHRVGVNVFNILGEFVFSSGDQNIVHERTIDMSSLTTGIYFIEVNIDGSRVMTIVMKE